MKNASWQIASFDPDLTRPLDQICGGRPSLHRPVTDPEHQVRLLRQVPHRLVYEEQIDCRDIVILAEVDSEASRALAGVLYELLPRPDVPGDFV